MEHGGRLRDSAIAHERDNTNEPKTEKRQQTEIAEHRLAFSSGVPNKICIE